ncbi:MAG: type 1 glutamine amidotransferase [Lachnospiraceae bacterium]|nr:type 1 glutamine amidotransferase [Lachnospiraceae bacterium]
MKKILMMTENKSEDTENLYPYYRLQEAGYEVEVAALTKKTVDLKFHLTIEATKTIDECRAEDYAGLVLPGGSAPEKVRLNANALKIVREMNEDKKPIAAICHGPQTLISAGVLKGRRATCYQGVRDDLINAGALYEDAPVVVDGNLVTSRRPEDLPAFMREYVRLLNA